MREEDRKAKASAIEAYFSELKRRVEVLPALYAAGYEDEALLVCCCYIEGLGTNLYWPHQRSPRNFVRVLEQYGGEGDPLAYPSETTVGIVRSNGA